MVPNINKILFLAFFFVSVLWAEIIAPGGGQEAPDCFASKHLTFAFVRYDPSNNFTGAYEYWMRKAHTCNIVLKEKSKLNWYSSDIKIIYQISYDLKDG